MSENKSKNLLFLLLLAALVIIAIMGSYIFNLNNTIDDLTPPKSALTEEDALSKAKTVLEKYVKLSDYETPDVGPMPYLLAELGLDTKDNLDTQCLKNPGSDAYIKSNVKYDDFKKAMLNYVSEEYFNNNFSGYINVDGNVGYKYIAMGSIPTSVSDVELFGNKTLLISKADQLKDLVDLNNKSLKFALFSGTSAPQELIDEIKKILMQ